MNLDENIVYQSLLNAIPSPVFVVDDDVRIVDLNQAACILSGQEKRAVLRRRGGEVLHCLHSTEVPGGCGRAPFCADCVIRNSVSLCLQGQTVSRARIKMDFLPATGRKPMELLITANPIPHSDERLALLILEDITEISTLKEIIPICMKCRKIRTDAQYWQTVEQYFHEHIGVDFSHGICPTCVNEFYPHFRRGEH